MPRACQKLPLLALILIVPPANAQQRAQGDPDPRRFENQIGAFEAADRQQMPPAGGVLFVGSSSIRRWDVARSFPGLPAINRGFGGSHLSDVVFYANRIVLPYRPRVIVVYAGDNDLWNGKSPERVVADFRRFVEIVHAQLPETRLVFLGIKPSPKRWEKIDRIRRANALVRQVTATNARLEFVDVDTPMLDETGRPRGELFVADQLHLSPAGYALWTRLLEPQLAAF